MEAPHTVGYIFLDHRDPVTQDASNICASLLKQVLHSFGSNNWPEEVYEKLKTMHSRQSLFDICDITDLLFICADRCSPLFLIFDGLDECEEQESQRKIMRFLNALQRQKKIKAFVTSRDYVVGDSFTIHRESKTSIEAQDRDIRLYIREKLKDKSIGDSLKMEIEEALISKAHGMYSHLTIILPDLLGFFWSLSSYPMLLIE